jgi:glutathione S-transferase
MAKLTLFSARACPFAHRTRLVLAHKAVPFELVEIDLQNKPAWFHTVSGYGKVPALEHGEYRVWESAVINEYLDEAFPSVPLLPRDPAARASARIWIDYANTRFAPAFNKLLRGFDDAERAAGRRELEETLSYIEHVGLASLSPSGPYFLGLEPSLVDFAFYPWIERWPGLEHVRGFAIPGEHTLLLRWRDDVKKLKAVIEHENSPEFYIERYAKIATAARKVA